MKILFFSQHDKMTVLWQVASRRSAVDVALAAVPDFLIQLVDTGGNLSKLQLEAALNIARTQIGSGNITCESLVKYAKIIGSLGTLLFYSEYSDWNSGFLNLLDSNLEGGGGVGGNFCSLVDAYYSVVWAAELESQKTAYGCDYLMSPGVMTLSELDAFTSNFKYT